MLRLHFTGDDLSRIRIASRPDPLRETMLSITLLGSGPGRTMFGPWRARARTELRRLPREHLRLLRHLAPPRGAFPDHAGTPREAGLIAATRLGVAVTHTLTPLGAALLNGDLEPQPTGYPVGNRRPRLLREA